MLSLFKGFKPIYLLLFILFDVLVFFAALAGNRFIFDEVYYLPSSVDTLHGVASNIEHPPLVKLVLAVSIGLFGDGWFGWRLPIVLCALVSVGLVYLIGRHFSFSERLSTFCAGLCCLSLVFLLMGATAMLDMPTLMFGLAGLYLALKNRFVLSGLAFGLCFLCKELAVLMFGVTLLYLVFQRVSWRKLLPFCGVAVAVAFVGVWLYDLVFQPFAGDVAITNPLDHFWLMIVWQLNLNGVRAPDLTQWYPPLSWVSPFGENAFNPLRWLWGMDTAGHYIFNFRGQVSVVVEYLTFPLLALLPIVYWLKRSKVALLSWLWVGATFLPWLLAGFFVRTEANFYIMYAVPFLAVGCGYLYTLLKNRKLKYGLALTQLVVGLVWLLYYFPLPLF
jgi:predicted membrane-bound dolichyl-phosphate-mannose-protein mannosyltransferase